MVIEGRGGPFVLELCRSQLGFNFSGREIFRRPPLKPFLDDLESRDIVRRPTVPRFHVSDSIVGDLLEKNAARTEFGKFFADRRLVSAFCKEISCGFPRAPYFLPAIDPFRIDIADPPIAALAFLKQTSLRFFHCALFAFLLASALVLRACASLSARPVLSAV